MAIIEKLLIKKPRESSGSDTQNRFDYQVNFAALLVLELLSDNKSFVTLMDHLDDIVILDDLEVPKQITFYQVKTTIDAEITLTTIISESYFSKMKDNVDAFSGENVKSILVSNANFKFNTKNSRDKKEIMLKDVNRLIKVKDFINDSEKKDDLFKAILESTFITEVDLENYYLLKTSLTLDDHSEVIKGKLLDYLVKINSKLDTPAINALYLEFNKKLKDLSRTTYVPQNQTRDELFKFKGFSQNDFEKIHEKAYNFLIPADPNKIYEFSVNTMKYVLKDLNISVFKNRYNEFTTNAIEYKAIYNSILSFLSNTDRSGFSNDKLIQGLLDECKKNPELSNTDFYKNFGDLVVLVYIFKEGQ